MKKLKQAHGNWVAGERFWNREEDIALFSERIREGAHVLLVAQRRMGKTSLMKEVARRLTGEFECVFVDLQKATTPQDAVAELSLALQPHKSLWQRSRELFANVLDKVEKVEMDDLAVTLRSGLTAGNWASKGDRLFAILAASEKPVLLLLDEVPILVNRIIKGGDYVITPDRRQTAGEFMSWLRKNSLEHQGKVRIVISGSIGFEPVLRQAGLSATINNFSPFDLKPWSTEVAEECLRALANEYQITFEGGAESAMVERLECCIPHHVQMFFGHAWTHCMRKRSTVFGAHEVEQVYQTEMLGTRGHAELTHYEERLKLVLGAEKLALALDMVTEAAVSDALTVQAIKRLEQDYTFEDEATVEVAKEVLWILEHDGYLTQTAGEYRFVSPLLRDWWKSRHELFFTPVMKRGE